MVEFDSWVWRHTFQLLPKSQYKWTMQPDDVIEAQNPIHTWASILLMKSNVNRPSKEYVICDPQSSLPHFQLIFVSIWVGQGLQVNKIQWVPWKFGSLFPSQFIALLHFGFFIATFIANTWNNLHLLLDLAGLEPQDHSVSTSMLLLCHCASDVKNLAKHKNLGALVLS